MKDTKTNSEQIFNRPPRRTTFIGPMVGKLPTSSGGSGGPTTYTKSVVNNETNHELTITNVENGVQKTPYKINYGGGGEAPIKIVNGTYDENEISESYLTYFTQGLNDGPFFKVGAEIKELIKSGDHYDGEITGVSVVNNTLVFTRYNQPDLIYNPYDNLPIGLVLLCTNGNFDPNVDLGGVWLMLPDGKYIKSCDNVQTSAGIYLPASLPPAYGSGVWERNGKYGSGTSIVDGGFRIIGNYAITGPSSQSGTTCPVVAFDAAWNTNYVNNPYREHGRAGEDGLVDVAHFTCMVWVKQANQQAKQKQIDLILNEWNNQIEKCNKEISQAKAILSTNTQKMSMKKDMTANEKLAIEKENEIQNRIVENRSSYIEKINKKIEIFKKLNIEKKNKNDEHD